MTCWIIPREHNLFGAFENGKEERERPGVTHEFNSSEKLFWTIVKEEDFFGHGEYNLFGAFENGEEEGEGPGVAQRDGCYPPHPCKLEGPIKFDLLIRRPN